MYNFFFFNFIILNMTLYRNAQVPEMNVKKLIKAFRVELTGNPRPEYGHARILFMFI